MEGWQQNYDDLRRLLQGVLVLVAIVIIVWLAHRAGDQFKAHNQALNQCIVAHKELLNAKEYCIALINLGGGR